MQKMQEMWVWSLGREGPLEYKMATPPQYSCLENSMDRGAWWAIVHGVVKSWTWLSTLACTYACKFLLIEIYNLINIKQHISSVTQSCATPCSPMDCSTPCFLVHLQFLELAQTHVHWVSGDIQPSHPLLSPSPPVFSSSQHQDLFQEVSSSYQVAKVLELQLQHQSFQWIFRADILYDGLLGSPCCPGDFKSLPQPHSSKASIFFGAQFSLWSNSHIIDNYWKKHSFD